MHELHDLQWVFFAAIAAAFVVALYFVNSYRRRGATTEPAVHGSRADAAGEATADFAAGIESARRVADAEAASIRQLAQTEADANRRAADAELRALRRAAESDVESAHKAAEQIRDRAAAEATATLADADRTGQAQVATLTAEAEAALRLANARQLEIDQLYERATEAAERLELDGAELDRQLRQLEARQHELETRTGEAAALRRQLELELNALEGRRSEHTAELERISGLSSAEAKVELLSHVEADARREAAALVRGIEAEARVEGADRARAVVSEAVQRVASAQTAESVVSVLHLPSDEMKGRIIGREGRNIRAFETVTGVNVIIDDTPEAVLLSCFDPVRREVGRLTLDKLVLDGRIHPHRIEEAYELSKIEVEQLCLRAAHDALAEVGITDLDERLLPTLGRLKYRTSYGQNVLGHLVETAHVAGVMAAELGIEPTLVKRGAFLHDIGKALTHEVEGSHAIVGAALLRKFGESEAVAHAVEAHHNEVHPRTIEAVLTQAADTCSASRPGARRESLEAYVKRLSRIEEIATAKIGVEKVFAMQAGREVRVMVQPGEVDDLEASVLAREIAKQIEDELTYPGQIRVTVVRESRATEIAH
ncbi:ribonucrease Y [Jatrophihabitans sp. GAS493]|uniref:ribonuclease Y n=1 Tax=Jatrophihabitans sp. GAS493 TaxID=1907575 RepID=UPI000BB82C33|nr:ribonuclease Y [Jatrophihabitans sp. GAS493]SOD74131.1 ribonucrease Y [Jatrophihabitans sp. GAS493]